MRFEIEALVADMRLLQSAVLAILLHYILYLPPYYLTCYLTFHLDTATLSARHNLATMYASPETIIYDTSVDDSNACSVDVYNPSTTEHPHDLVVSHRPVAGKW